LDYVQNGAHSRRRFAGRGLRCYGLEQINGPLKFDQGPQWADVSRRASMALVGHSEQRAAAVRLGFPQLMPQGLIEGGRKELAFQRGAPSATPFDTAAMAS
jgi:hypothetical protein